MQTDERREVVPGFKELRHASSIGPGPPIVAPYSPAAAAAGRGSGSGRGQSSEAATEPARSVATEARDAAIGMKKPRPGINRAT